MVAMMSCRSAITMIHGMLFGAFFLLAGFALVLEMIRLWHPHTAMPLSERGRRLESMYLALTAACGWLAVLSGTYIVYPWYRAAPPAGADLHNYPRSLLLANAATAPLHSIGMEWKEHIAFIGPIVFTAVAWGLARYPAQVRRAEVRRVLLAFSVAAFVSTAVPGAVGALLNKSAPTDGPKTAAGVPAGDNHATR